MLAIYMGFTHIYLVGCDYTHVPARNLHWYEKGQGVIQDYIIAHMWLNIASSNASKQAPKQAPPHTTQPQKAKPSQTKRQSSQTKGQRGFHKTKFLPLCQSQFSHSRPTAKQLPIHQLTAGMWYGSRGYPTE